MQKTSVIPEIELSEYTYELPQERIALYPLEERDKSKLLVANAAGQSIRHATFSGIVREIPRGSLIVRNITRVLQARIFLSKQTGGQAEVLVTEPVEPSADPLLALQAKNSTVWQCIIGGRKITAGTVLSTAFDTASGNILLSAEVLEKDGMNATVRFSWEGGSSFAEILEAAGRIPLPPYIRRDAEESDLLRYQTVYAREQGSVAAPTAGLHFTERVFEGLREKEVDVAEVTLHVGLGTFKPLEAETIAGHSMHAEKISVPASTIDRIIAHFRNQPKESAGTRPRLVSVGTTSTRTLESLYWFGLKLLLGDEGAWEGNTVFLDQWEPYELRGRAERLPEAAEVLPHLRLWMEKHGLKSLSGETRIIIVPGYDFRVCEALITNFHQPGSTLILLVAAFAGREFWRKIYDEALANGYRFLSYGDASLLLR